MRPEGSGDLPQVDLVDRRSSLSEAAGYFGMAACSAHARQSPAAWHRANEGPGLIGTEESRMKLTVWSFAFACCLAAVVAEGSVAAPALPSGVRQCRRAVIKDAARYASALTSIVAGCHERRDALELPASTDCNDVEQAANALGVTLAATVFKTDVGAETGACGGVEPAQAFYTSCPIPCDAITVSDWASVDRCMGCQIKTHVEGFAAEAFKQSVLPLSAVDLGCARSLYAVSTTIIPLILRSNTRCHKRDTYPNACLQRSGRWREMHKLVQARRRVSALVAGVCKSADFAAVGGCATTLADAGCVLAAAQNYGELLAYDGSRMLGRALSTPAATFAQVSTNVWNSCGIRTDGSLQCWGDNISGGVSPVPPGTFAQVSVGFDYGCGLRADGSVDCWTGEYARLPQTSAPAGTFVQVSAGYLCTCGLRADQSLQCWGFCPDPPSAGTFQQVSVGTWNVCGIRSDATVACWDSRGWDPLSPHGAMFAQVSAGGVTDCALRTDGSVECWGPNNLQPSDRAGPFVQVSAGANHRCALRTDGSVECWGDEAYDYSSVPPGPFVQISARGDHNCGLRPDGSLQCWGPDEDGQSSVPDGIFTQVSAGHDHACGVRTDRSVACWGQAVGIDASYYGGPWGTPAGTFAQVSTGYYFACGVRTDRSLQCWGFVPGHPHGAPFAQVSVGRDEIRGLRMDGTVWGTTAPAGTFTQLSAGWGYTCGVRTDETVSCWGADDSGQASPPAVPFVQVSAGPDHACGVRTDATVRCWGARADGQAAAPGGTFSQVSAGESHTCGIRTDGSVDCWGRWYGRYFPAPTGTFVQISAGGRFTCGIRTDGRAVCWGRSFRD